jgi:hypothetical protein
MGKIHAVGKVVIRVYANDHLPPHFHVISPAAEALLTISPLAVIRGELPKGASGAKALQWAKDNIAVIVAEWNRINPRFPA